MESGESSLLDPENSSDATALTGSGGSEMRDVKDPDKGSKERVPLKTVLQNFLNHVESLEARRREGDDAYEKEFQSLKLFSDQLKCQAEYSCGEGEKDVNRKKNRYKDILPFDYTRVALSEYPGVPGSDYINANFIKGASGSNAYIACQGPLPHTVNDFWRMVVECEVQVIVMACNEQEAGKHKCEKYWTELGEDEDQLFGKYSVKLLKSRDICPDFLVRTMRLRWRNADTGGDSSGGEEDYDEERTVCQFHYSAWPDHGIPTQVKPLLEMVRLIRDCQASETLPVLIHCSAGCGRTGTICAIDYIWGLLRTGKLTSDFSLYELVRNMRKQRIAMVQTVDQYVLVHRAVKELFLEQMRVIDAHPYENVDDDGRPLCGQKDREDDITPDYETVFVKNEDAAPIDSGEIDKILTDRMKRNQLLKSFGSDERQPPNPPPKQRHLDPAKAIDSRNVIIPPATTEDNGCGYDGVLVPKPEPVLFEPPSKGTPDKENSAGPQKFKKGNLRLTQTEDGGWKLEELEEALPISQSQVTMPETGAKNSSLKNGRKKTRKKKDDDDTSPKLLRKPSIKKLRAFFNKDKDSKESTPSPESSPGDADVSSAISKLPKFEPDASPPPQVPLSRSVPGSLDRRCAERVLSNGEVQEEEPEKPSLPVKRSKSMKNGGGSVMTTSNSFPPTVINSGESQTMYQAPPKPKRTHSTNYSGNETPSEQQYADEARRVMRDCQDYLMASFDVAEKEGERLMLDKSLRSKGSAESSPNTTLQSAGNLRQFRSSHSSPSNSFSKYASVDVNKSFSSSPGRPSAQRSPIGSGSPQGSKHSPTLKLLEATDTRNYSRNRKKEDQVDALIHEYANVDISGKKESNAGYENVAIEAAQRGVSAAVPKARERRNSFREAVEAKGDEASGKRDKKKPYESVWFGKGGEEASLEFSGSDPSDDNVSKSFDGIVHHDYANVELKHKGSHSMSCAYEDKTDEVIAASGPSGYEPINFKDGSTSKSSPKGQSTLQSVGLVSEVMSGNKTPVRKQNSSSSAASSGKGPPPPYKQPPQVLGGSRQRTSPVAGYHRHHRTSGERQHPESRHYQNVPSEGMLLRSTFGATYANIPYRQTTDRAFARPQPNTTNDDLALTYYQQHRQQEVVQRPFAARSNSNHNINPNRFSYGDFCNHNSWNKYQASDGLTVKALPPEINRSQRAIETPSGRQVPPPLMYTHGSSTGDLLPGIDIDTVAAMMHGKDGTPGSSMSVSMSSIGNLGGSNRPIGKTLAGVISGAAANIRSRFSHLSSAERNSESPPSGTTGSTVGGGQGGLSSNSSKHQQHFSPSSSHNMIHTISTDAPLKRPAGEQVPPSALPATVPGAASVGSALYNPSVQMNTPSYQYNYPHRPESRPAGPREPPLMFQRKQEYL